MIRRIKNGKTIWIFVLILALTGCFDTAPEPVSATVFAMDTVTLLTVYGEEAEEAVRLARAEILRLDRLFSVTRVESDIGRLNAAGGETLLVSAETAEVLDLALELWAETEGRFSPGLYALQRAWGFTTEENRVPAEEEIRALLESVDLGGIHLEGLYVTVPAGLELDLGAIAKGYVGDRLLALLTELGTEAAIFSLGGDVIALGGHPGGGPWRVAIRNPLGEGFLGTVELWGGAVNTSGSYERRFVAEAGEVYHHILDPETGRPARSGLVSVTVVSREGARGDAWSTALFVMGLEEGLARVAEIEDLEAIFVTEGGGIYVTAGLEGVFLPERDVTWVRV